MIQLQGPDDTKLYSKIIDNKDQTYKVLFAPDDVGQYKVNVKYGGKPVPGSPFSIKTTPTGQAEKCKVTGKCYLINPTPIIDKQ